MSMLKEIEFSDDGNNPTFYFTTSGDKIVAQTALNDNQIIVRNVLVNDNGEQSLIMQQKNA